MTIIGTPFIGICRLNFAWEILRRVPSYITAYYENLRGVKQNDRDCYADAQKWGLLKFR